MSQKLHVRTSPAFPCVLPEAVVGPPSVALLCTSGFVDDGVFSSNGSCGGVTLPQQPRCSTVNGITPLLRACRVLRLVLDAGVNARRVHHERAIRGLSCTVALLWLPRVLNVLDSETTGEFLLVEYC